MALKKAILYYMYRMEHAFAKAITLSLLAACCSNVKAHTCRSVGQGSHFLQY